MELLLDVDLPILDSDPQKTARPSPATCCSAQVLVGHRARTADGCDDLDDTHELGDAERSHDEASGYATSSRRKTAGTDGSSASRAPPTGRRLASTRNLGTVVPCPPSEKKAALGRVGHARACSHPVSVRDSRTTLSRPQRIFYDFTDEDSDLDGGATKGTCRSSTAFSFVASPRRSYRAVVVTLE